MCSGHIEYLCSSFPFMISSMACFFTTNGQSNAGLEMRKMDIDVIFVSRGAVRTRRAPIQQCV